ncbi:MAG: hypothetical protein GYA21_16545 [Myxococcales bacterium]|nr:hypothetical protein [Myxococcales bacterium]
MMGGEAKLENNRLSVFSIIEREGKEKPLWLRIGTCFPNRDGSFNVLLDALPRNGKLHIRKSDREPDRSRDG